MLISRCKGAAGRAEGMRSVPDAQTLKISAAIANNLISQRCYLRCNPLLSVTPSVWFFSEKEVDFAI